MWILTIDTDQSGLKLKGSSFAYNASMRLYVSDLVSNPTKKTHFDETLTVIMVTVTSGHDGDRDVCQTSTSTSRDDSR